MRLCIERSNDLVTLPPFRFWLDCTINTSGYDFRKGQEPVIALPRAPAGVRLRQEGISKQQNIRGDREARMRSN
jgi:hypothetical protein